MKNSEYIFYKEAAREILPDLEHLRLNVLNGAQRYKSVRKKQRRLIPILACVSAAVLICATVPPVRAAIAQWFEVNFSVQSYVAQPPAQRVSTPELEAIIADSKPDVQQTASSNSVEIVEIAPEWREWADKLNPSVGDIYYDGEQLIVGFDMGGGVPEFALGGTHTESSGEALEFPYEIWMGNPGYIFLNGQIYQASCDANITESTQQMWMKFIDEKTGLLSAEGVETAKNADSISFASTIRIEKPADLPDDFASLSYDEQAALMDEAIATFDASQADMPKLEGVQQVEVYMPLVLTDFSKPIQEEDAISYQGTEIGKLKLSFSFDTNGARTNEYIAIDETVNFSGSGTYMWSDWESEAGYTSFVNKTVDMSGVSMTAQKLEISPTYTKLYLGMNCPDDWSERDKACFISALGYGITGNGSPLIKRSETFLGGENGEDSVICIELSILPSELKALRDIEIIPSLSRYSGYDNTEYVEGKLTKISNDDITGWQEDSTTLTDSVLQFSMN